MPRVVRAEFLSYYNSARNSDKVFNVFLIEDDDGTFRCVTEYGRRGNNLVRDTLCTKQRREMAESKLRQKLIAKRNHRETPYADDPFGQNISPLAGEYGFNQARNNNVNSNQANQPQILQSRVQQKQNVIEFPAEKIEKERQKPKQTGILNKEQFDSLEI